MKVYCKDCKYFQRAGDNIDTSSGSGGSWGDYCAYHQRTGQWVKIEDPKRGYKKEWQDNKIKLFCETDNKNFNCKYYIRSWYRIWVPKNKGIADGKLSIAEQDNNSGNLSIV